MNDDHDMTSSTTNDLGSSTSAGSATDSPVIPQTKPKQRRGFAAMDPRLVAEIASKGGKAAHAAGTAHEFTSDEARDAGRKGGLAPHQRRRATPATNPT
jgi:uncharacterized protein